VEVAMNIPPDFKLTDAVFWWGALIVALVDAAWMALLARRVKAGVFPGLKRWLVLVAALFWAGLWWWVLTNFWDIVYGYFFPAELRGWLPLLYGLLFAAIAWLLWLIAVRTRFPVAVFCLLGALTGALTHLWAVYRGILIHPPMLQGLNPFPVLLFATAEFGFYWCLILSLASLLKGWSVRIK
jgi:hypothetical protein